HGFTLAARRQSLGSSANTDRLPDRARGFLTNLRVIGYIVRCLAASALLALVSGCGRQSIVSPRSPQTHEIRTLWWWMLVIATVVFAGALAMLIMSWFRRGTSGLPFPKRLNREPVSQGLVVVFGIAIPVAVLVGLFSVADVYLVG